MESSLDRSLQTGGNSDSMRFKPSWLLALCAVLDVIISGVYLFAYRGDGPLTYHAGHRMMVSLGWLTLAAGISTLAAGIWNLRKATRSWLLVLNGLACSLLGTIFAFWTRPLAFRSIALLIVVMALSIGTYELTIARVSRRVSDEWLLGAVGVISIFFASAFLAFVFRWITLQPGAPTQSLHWLASYFACSAVCMLALLVSPPVRRLS